MVDNADPRAGWLEAEYRKHSLAARGDDFGAVFFYLLDLLVEFCECMRTAQVSFELFCTDAVDIGNYVNDKRFDRVKVRTAPVPS